jgi:hypothetical protein
LSSRLLQSPRPPSQGSWSTLADIDNLLLKTGIVPASTPDSNGIKTPNRPGE